MSEHEEITAVRTIGKKTYIFTRNATYVMRQKTLWERFKEWMGRRTMRREGDVVQYSQSIGFVDYDLNNVGGCRFFINSKEERAFEDEMGVKFAWCELEVLGNIYENGDLLK